jgi:hypothetical protein
MLRCLKAVESGITVSEGLRPGNSKCCLAGTISLPGIGCGHDEFPGTNQRHDPDRPSLATWQFRSQSTTPLGTATHIQQNWDAAYTEKVKEDPPDGAQGCLTWDVTVQDTMAASHLD